MQNAMLDSIVSSNSQELSNASSAIKLFENPLFKVRVIMWLGDPWFVASDACKCLELKDDAGTICRELDEQDKVTLSREEFMGGVSNRGIICSVDSRVQSLVFVSESGLYDLIMQSRKPEAKAFKRWVTHEVLPSIRKTGGYGIRTVDDMINDPDTAIRLLTQLKILRLQNDQLEMERDEAIRTKAQIGSRREATAMNTASQKSKECEKLREQIGDSKTYKAVTAITWLPDYFNMSNRGLYGSLAANLKKIEAGMTSEFKHIDIPDSRFGKVKAYHVDVIERLHEMVQADENLMAKYRKITSV